MYSENGLIPYIQMLTFDSEPLFCAISGPYNYQNGFLPVLSALPGSRWPERMRSQCWSSGFLWL
jgi:hypothetical protein